MKLNEKGKRVKYLEITTCEDNFCKVLSQSIEDALNKMYRETGVDWSIADIKYAVTTVGEDIVKSALVLFTEE